jgi:hypothetical protein
MSGDHEPGATVTFAVVGAGAFEVSRAEALILAVRVREFAREDERDEQQVALMLEASLAAAAETILIDRSLPVFREALELVVSDAAETATAGLLELRRRLTR